MESAALGPPSDLPPLRINRHLADEVPVDFFFDIPAGRRRWVTSLDPAGTGLVQCSTARQQGRKMFIWGIGPGGRRWQRHLSDRDAPYIELQAGLARTQYECLPMPPHAHWHWTEAYGLLESDPATVHGADWPAATRHAEEQLEQLLPAAELEAHDATPADWSAAARAPFLHRGAGWGALEVLRLRHEGLEPAAIMTLFPEDSIGEEQRPWAEMLKTGRFAPAKATAVGCQTGDFWENRLREALRDPGTAAAAAWFHLGVVMRVAGDCWFAREAWRTSVNLEPTAAACFALGVLAEEESGPQAAADHYEQATRLAPDHPTLNSTHMTTKLLRSTLLPALLALQASPLIAQQHAPAPPPVTTFEQLFTKATPAVEKRGVHLHLTGLPPTAERFVQLLKLFAAARFNVVVIEWEDSFPWTVDERFRSRTAYTPEDIRRICQSAADLKLELIPLVQCLGHMETPLSTPGYEHLREVPENSSGINPLDPKSRELVQRMVDDVLALMPGVKQFHLGGDEARTLGQNPDTKAFIAQHGKGALYLQHVGPILDNLNARHIRPILWHDMMIDWNGDALKSLAARCDLMVWGYAGHPDTTQLHYNTKYIKRFHEHGLVLWGATAYKGAEGNTPERHTADRPVLEERIENASAWIDIHRRFNLTGIVATGWSRWSVDTLQCVPIDAALDSLVAVAAILHDGELSAGGVEDCVGALAELGEKERFEACRKAMERLTNVRRSGWTLVRQVREHLALCQLDPRRTSARSKVQGNKGLGNLQGAVRQSQRVADEVRRSFAGLIDPVWIEEYLTTRLQPLKDELDELTARDAALE